MRRLGQALVLLLMAISAVGAGASIAIALYYHGLSTAVRKASLPATVDAVLPRPAGTLDASQITLVRGSGTPASGGVVLLRTVPDAETTALLSIPRSAILAGEPVGRLGTPGLVRGLRTTIGLGVSHVAIVDLSHVSPEAARGDQAQQRALGDVVAQALAPTRLTQLPATRATIAETVTDLTAADLLGLVWTRLDDRREVQCAVAEHQAIDSAAGRAAAAVFLGRGGSGRVAACSGRSIAPAVFVPPKAALAMVQRFGAWVFAAIAAAAMLMSLGTSRLFARMRFVAPAAPGPLPGAARPGLAPAPAPAISMFESVPKAPRVGDFTHAGAAVLAGAGVAVRRALRGGAARVHAWRSRAVALIGTERAPRSGYRSRLRRYVYLHQDALWVGLVAAVAVGILIRLLAA
jgi:hypothetical protein